MAGTLHDASYFSATFILLSLYAQKILKNGPTLRAAHKNFTPTDLYAVGVVVAPNFAPAITKKQWLQEFFFVDKPTLHTSTNT